MNYFSKKSSGRPHLGGHLDSDQLADCQKPGRLETLCYKMYFTQGMLSESTFKRFCVLDLWDLFLFSSFSPFCFFLYSAKGRHFIIIVRSVNIVRMCEDTLIISPLIFLLTFFLPLPPQIDLCCSAPFSFLIPMYTNIFVPLQGFSFTKILCYLLLICLKHPSLHSHLSFANFVFLHCKDSLNLN